MALKIHGTGWEEKKNGNCKSFTKLDTIIILAINDGKAPELDFFFLPYICFFSITERGETFPLAAQQPCPRGRGYN